MANLYKREPKETVDGRLMNFLLKDPIMDGGQWDMVVNIIKKHGLYILDFLIPLFPRSLSNHLKGKIFIFLIFYLQRSVVYLAY